MALNRFSIEDLDHQKFGELIKAWAMGKKPIPKDIEGFKQVMKDEGIKAHYPHGENALKKLNIFHGEVERLDIRLPPRRLIVESEAYLSKPGNTYPLPRYYELVFGNKPHIPDPLAFHAARVGDYTVANCA